MAAAIVVAINCNNGPTTPTPVNPPVVPIVPAPVPVVASISSVIPAAPAQSAVAQILSLAGIGFQAGQVLRVTAPSGAVTVVEGTDIQAIAPTSFQASVMLSEAGRYALAVRQANGDVSASFSVDVREAVAIDAIITGVSPAMVSVGATLVTVSLAGSNFDPSMIVQVVDPDSLLIEWDAEHRPSETTALIQFSMVFSKIGDYRISLWSPLLLGPVSNTVIVRVR